jgi:hypothetical protein
MASISSMKMIDGALFRASAKRSRTDHEHPTRSHSAGARVALGALEEIDDFGHLLLRPFVPCNVGESRQRLLLVVDLGFRAAESHDA